MREMPPSPVFTGTPSIRPIEYPKLQHLMTSGVSEAAKDGALQNFAGTELTATIGLNFLGVGNGLMNYNPSGAPPDTNAAIGDTQIVQWVNEQYTVFDKKTGKPLTGIIDGNQFWSGIGGACGASNDGDIIIQWDKTAHKWIAAQNVLLTSGPPFFSCIAVSETNDATGKFFQFAYQDSGDPDYPKYGIFRNGKNNGLFSSDNIDGSSAHPCAYQLDKLIKGDKAALRICFQTGVFDDSLLPADQDSTIAPPKGEDEVYMGSIDNGNPNNSDKVYWYKFHVNFANPGNSSFTGAGGTMPITVASFGLACGGYAACIPQKGIGNLLDSLGDRLMYRLAYRNLKTSTGLVETWVVTHSVTASSSVGARWYEFRSAEKGTPALFQQGTFAPDSKFRWMGSIAMDKVGDIALGYSVSSSDIFPAIRFTGRVPSDPKGTMRKEASIVEGKGSQVLSSNRWGDYSSMAMDNDGCTLMYTTEYYQITQAADWSTQVATLKFPSCK